MYNMITTILLRTVAAVVEAVVEVPEVVATVVVVGAWARCATIRSLLTGRSLLSLVPCPSWLTHDYSRLPI